MQKIDIRDVCNVKIGQTEDKEAGTGVTVVIAEQGMTAGLAIRGGGPASRETYLLNPLSSASVIHAIVLGGGSAFGLDAAGGVMQYLEEKRIGFPVRNTVVPLVCQSDIFDLLVGTDRRPDQAMGRKACEAAEKGLYRDGCYGAGTGATVGKLNGMEHCMKSGIGSFAVQEGELKIGAIAVVNAIGNVYDPDTGRMLAGVRSREGEAPLSVMEQLILSAEEDPMGIVANTTISIVLTNAAFSKAKMCRIASMAHNAYARTIRPVNLSTDGDSVYAVSCGTVVADEDVVGTMAEEVLSRAIVQAVKQASSAYGYPAWQDMQAE